MTTKRPYCTHCLRPQSTCICHWRRPVDHATEVLILQHPLEVEQAKGSARLLHMNLPRSRLVVGETFDEATLRSLLFAPLFPGDGSAVDCTVHPVLLYPDDATNQAGMYTAEVASPSSIRHRLVVIDGTWRKSRKMLYRNPLLQQLPRLTLNDTAASRYSIRKAHRPHQLSTFEATCLALIALEGNAHAFQPLLEAFDGFVAEQHVYAEAGRKIG